MKTEQLQYSANMFIQLLLDNGFELDGEQQSKMEDCLINFLISEDLVNQPNQATPNYFLNNPNKICSREITFMKEVNPNKQ